MSDFDYDYLIIGSGFGGSVSALRLAEKGWRVGVLEQGNRVDSEAIKAAKKNPLRRFMWAPEIGSRGYSTQTFFRHVGVLGGVGVGGGSLVWGAVMLPPKDSFYAASVWQQLGVDMRQELAEHLAAAKRMLGVTPNPGFGKQDQFLQQAAESMGKQDSYGPVPQAIYFGEPGQPADDPFFDGKGPSRQGCRLCGECLAGCEHGSKNSLDKNYLYLAEQLGVDILAQSKASKITPVDDGYAVEFTTLRERNRLTARKVIVAAGVIGTLELLLRNRDEHQTLPKLSTQCGQTVRTNSEALTAVLCKDRNIDLLTDGAAISSDFYADANTHLTQNRIAPALASLVRIMFVPMVDDDRPLVRALKTLAKLITHPHHWFGNLFGRRWSNRITTLTVMQNDDSGVSMRLKRSWLMPWRRKLQSALPPKGLNRAPSYLPQANAATHAYAKAANGIALSSSMEALGNKAMTAHILGGCDIGVDAETAVIDANHEVHGHPGLFVVDGSAIPANLGVNPSLTITAMAERFASLQPRRD